MMVCFGVWMSDLVCVHTYTAWLYVSSLRTELPSMCSRSREQGQRCRRSCWAGLDSKDTSLQTASHLSTCSKRRKDSWAARLGSNDNVSPRLMSAPISMLVTGYSRAIRCRICLTWQSYIHLLVTAASDFS